MYELRNRDIPLQNEGQIIDGENEINNDRNVITDTIQTQMSNTKDVKGLNTKIEYFEGDPKKVKWFKEEVLEMKDIFNWSDSQAIFFMRKNLKGPAKEFYASSPYSQNANTIEQALQILEEFYHEESSPTAKLIELNSIRMIPGENIKSLAHRIQTATVNTYNQVKDAKILNQIQKLTLLTALPTEIRIKIMEWEEDTFENIVNKLSKIVQTTQVNQMLNMHNTTHMISQMNQYMNKELVCQFCGDNDHIMMKCDKFNQKFEQLRMTSDSKIRECHNIQNGDKNRTTSDNFNKRNIRSRYVGERRPKVCTYCQKDGHIVADCWRYKQDLKKSIEQEKMSERNKWQNWNKPKVRGNEQSKNENWRQNTGNRDWRDQERTWREMKPQDRDRIRRETIPTYEQESNRYGNYQDEKQQHKF